MRKILLVALILVSCKQVNKVPVQDQHKADLITKYIRLSDSEYHLYKVSKWYADIESGENPEALGLSASGFYFDSCDAEWHRKEYEYYKYILDSISYQPKQDSLIDHLIRDSI